MQFSLQKYIQVFMQEQLYANIATQTKLLFEKVVVNARKYYLKMHHKKNSIKRWYCKANTVTKANINIFQLMIAHTNIHSSLIFKNIIMTHNSQSYLIYTFLTNIY